MGVLNLLSFLIMSRRRALILLQSVVRLAVELVVWGYNLECDLIKAHIITLVTCFLFPDDFRLAPQLGG